MEHWQQTAYREDPYEDIPFHEGNRFDKDMLVGIVCLVAAFVSLFV